MRLAAADIGSNTAHILIADVDQGHVQRIENQSEWLSLGKVVAKTGTIPKAVEGRLLEVLQGYRKLARHKGAERLYVFATEAVRKAKGHEAVIKRLNSALDLEIEVIEPEREAELAMSGALIDMPTSKPSHFIEVGGGSAQVAYWEKGKIAFDVSLPLGTGVLEERHGLTHPASESAVRSLDVSVQAELDCLDGFPSCPRLVVSGGVARGIWRALHPDGDPNISLEELRYLEWSCSRASVMTIERRFRVKEKRAATLFVGALVYRSLMRRLQHGTMRVSVFGVREGAVLMMSSGKIAGVEP